MASVFVSYAREDAAKAKAIASALEQASIDLWFDERIQSGSEYSLEIEEALARASAVVVLWSKNSIGSAWVRDEAAEGRDSGRLVSVLLDECRPPIGFRQFQTADLSGWSGRGRSKPLDNVIAAVRAKVGAPPAADPKPAPAPQRQSRRPIVWLVSALGLASIAILAWFLTRQLGDRPSSTPSVGLLPFSANSSDPEARKLAVEVHDAIAHTLAQGAFELRLIDAVPPGAKPPADYMITGQLTTERDKTLATIRMEDAANRSVVFSDQFNSSLKEVASFPDRVGAQVAAQLSWTAPLIAIERKHPSDPGVVSALLQQRNVIGEDVSALQDYHVARRLALKAPNSAIAQMGLGFNTAFALAELPRGEQAEAIAAGRRATARAHAVAPEFGEPFIPWCLLHSPVRMIECENRLRTAMRVDPDAPFANWFLSQLLNNMGRNADATELARLSLAHDPYMPHKIAQMIRMLEVTGQSEEAANLYRQSTGWWPDHGEIQWYRLSGMIERGDFEASRRFESEIATKTERNPVLAAITTKSLARIQKVCSADEVRGGHAIMCILALAQFGDPDSAFMIAQHNYPSRRGRTLAEEDRMWLDDPGPLPLAFLTSPVAAALRRDPRYIALADRLGLLQYWRGGRPPDFCRDRPEPICSKLLARR